MQRDMTYELDDAFSTRNDGEVLLVDEARPRVLRSGRSTDVSRPNAVALRDAGPVEVDAEVMRDTITRADGMAGVEVTLPVLGKVNLLHVGIGIAIGAAVLWVLKRKQG
jgi:hypothetical protein